MCVLRGFTGRNGLPYDKHETGCHEVLTLVAHRSEVGLGVDDFHNPDVPRLATMTQGLSHEANMNHSWQLAWPGPNLVRSNTLRSFGKHSICWTPQRLVS